MDIRKFSNAILIGLICLDLFLIFFLLGSSISVGYLAIIKSQAVFLAIISIVSFINSSTSVETGIPVQE